MDQTEQPRTVPLNGDDGAYLVAVAIHGRCVCEHGALCSEQSQADNPGRMHCRLCQVLDPEWPCPTLDEDASYPDPDRVFVEGSPAAERAPAEWARAREIAPHSTAAEVADEWA